MQTRYLAATFGMLLPALFYLVPFARYGELPYNDYYGVIATISHDNGELVSDPLAWIQLKSNEHSVLLPGLIYAANIWLFDGDNRGHSAAALIFLALTFAFVWSYLPRSWRDSNADCFLGALAVGMFVFTPVTSHNVVMGFSGVMWFLANALAVGSFFVLLRASEHERQTWVWILVLTGLLAAFTYSTHLAMWPALGIGWLLLGADRKTLPPLLTGAIIAIGTHLALRTDRGNPPPGDSLAEIPVFLLGYLGLPYSRELTIARGMGTLAALATLALIWRTLYASRETRRRLTPWAMLVVYGTSAGLGTATARAGIPQIATSTRYATLAAFVWLGLLVGWLLLYEKTWANRRKSTVVHFVLAATVLALPTYSYGSKLLKHRLKRADNQTEAALALRLGITHPATLEPLTPWTGHLLAARPFLQSSGHVPFDRPDLRGHPAEELDLQVTPNAGPIPQTAIQLEEIQRLSDDSLRLSGWARAPIEGVWLLGKDLTLRGGTTFGPRSTGTPETPRDRVRWIAMMARPCSSRKLPSLYAQQGTELRPVPLDRRQKKRLRNLRARLCLSVDHLTPRPKARSEAVGDAG